MRLAQRGRIFMYDALAGFTVLAMCVPQSLAYGQLTGLGAVFGLYTTTFPLFVYFILGTSRQLSVGALMRIFKNLQNLYEFTELLLQYTTVHNILIYRGGGSYQFSCWFRCRKSMN